MAAFLHAELRQHGVRLLLGHSVAGFQATDSGLHVLLQDGQALPADLAVLAIGVAPDTQLARDAGLALGLKGSILVNERMETSCPDIYAVGDAVQMQNFVTGQTAPLPCRACQ